MNINRLVLDLSHHRRDPWMRSDRTIVYAAIVLAAVCAIVLVLFGGPVR